MTSNDAAATRAQLIALQTLYSQWSAHTFPAGADARAARLAWATAAIGRQVFSFRDLTDDEARALIDMLKGSMGQPLIREPRPWRRIRSRERAHAAGTSGRKDADAAFIQMASPDDLARIDEALRRLGWSEEQYAAWLRSSVSPVPSKADSAIRTVAEANKIWWALKAMLRRSGNWVSCARRQERGHLGRSASAPRTRAALRETNV
ncbi:MAG: hypothetical protein ABR865_07815 [Terracidiphilus sp.]|jgi:hypothetical protein